MKNALLDFAQGASNSAADTVAAPVDGIAWLLRKAGLPVPQAPVGGSDWMAQRGLTAKPKNAFASALGESAGLISPMVAAARAPQIANALLKVGENALAPRAMSAGLIGGQRGAVDVGKYGIEHRPMSDAGGAARLHDLASAFGDDIYTPNALQFFGSGDAREKAVLRVLNGVRGKPDAMVTIYRGGPKDMAGINAGDWVTLDPRVASDYAAEGGRVVSMQVPASHITSWADSLLEFGYYPPKK